MEQQLQSQVNFYELLGIDRKASDTEVKKAYRNLVKQYHPDLSNKSGTVKSFQLIQTAYEVLSDPQKRAIYDNLLYRRENGLDQPGLKNDGFTRFRRRNTYQYTTYGREAHPKTRTEKFQFHVKQVIGLVITTILSIIGIGLIGLGFYFIFIQNFNGAMLAGYASTASGIGIMVSVVKAFRVIGDIWVNGFHSSK